MQISMTDEKYIHMASLESKNSNLISKHGCVAVVNGKILGRGYNTSRTSSSDGFICNTCSCHAEIATLRNMYHNCCSNTYGKYSKNIKVGYQYTQNRKIIQKNSTIYSKNG
jgi:deoxycytidylate deaminase